MADRPILFSAPMVVALLEGRKTQTRRVLKPRKGLTLHELITEGEQSGNEYRCRRDQVQEPRINVGDRLYVREAHYLTDDGDYEYAVYTADGAEAVGEHLQEIASLENSHPAIDWSRHKKQRPGIHMPRWASRLTLPVTDVRVERLQDISKEDAIAEGILFVNDNYGNGPAYCDFHLGNKWDTAEWFASPVDSYRSLWNQINGENAWDDNPWVVAVSFEVLKQNIDEVA